jgi:alpha-1,2-mannosyltransferase
LIDFEVYTQAGRTLLAGENIYQRAYTVTDRWGRAIQLHYLYPPFLAQVLSTFSTVNERTLRFWWCAINFLMLIVTTVAIARTVAGSWWGSMPLLRRSLVLAFFVLCFEPIYVGNGDGQVTALILGLLALTICAAVTKHEVAAGALLALAAHIKMTPALLILAPLMFGRWRMVISCIIACALLTLPTIFGQIGVQPFLDFAASLTHTVNDTLVNGYVFNLVIYRALLEPFGLADVALARHIVICGLLLVTVVGTWRIRTQPGMAYLRSFGFLTVAMIIISPIVWFHHFAWMLIPLAILSMKPSATPDDRMRHLTLTLGLYFALSQTYLFHIWVHKLAPTMMSLSTLVPTLLVITVGALIYRQREP